MPFAMGPFGWYYGMPYGHPGYGGYSPYYGGYYPYLSPWGYIPKEQEKAILEGQVSILDQLEQIRKRLDEIEKGSVKTLTKNRRK